VDNNPYKPPAEMSPAPLPTTKATVEGTDWFALGGLFVGVVATVVVGSTLGLHGLLPGNWEPGMGETLASITAIGTCTLLGWLTGRRLRRWGAQ
jgi:hypothetical protein